MKTEETILYCRDRARNIDKEYRAKLWLVTGGYALQFAWGRRGSTLQLGKLNVFRSEGAARIEMEEQLDSKRRKGYTSPQETARKTTADIKERQREALGLAELDRKQKLDAAVARDARRKPRRKVRPYKAAGGRISTEPKPAPKPKPIVLGGVRKIRLRD